jgi:hypothetical protein
LSWYAPDEVNTDPKSMKDSWMDWLDRSTISCKAIHSPTFRCCWTKL